MPCIPIVNNGVIPEGRQCPTRAGVFYAQTMDWGNNQLMASYASEQSLHDFNNVHLS
jgi:hypothetical protein